MKNLNKKSDFDHFWEKTFSEAEMAPPEGVWDRIDANLSREEAGKFKKRAFMFKLLAAASVAFALGIGAFSLNYYLSQNAAMVVSESATIDSNSNSTLLLPEKQTNPPSADQSTELYDKSDTKRVIPTVENKYDANTPVFNHQSIESKSAVTTNNSAIIPGRESVNKKPTSIMFPELLPHGIQPTANDEELMAMVPEHIYLIPIMPRGSSKKASKDDDTNFIAGLDFSTGIFDPGFAQNDGAVFQGADNYYAMARTESLDAQLGSFSTVNKNFLAVRNSGLETSPAVSFSYGANMGFKVTRRILLQSGFTYRQSNSTTTSTAYIEDIGSGQRVPVVASYNYQLEGLSAVNSMDETSLTNQYEFASVPVRAGYILMDKKVNLTVLAGLSSEFFLGNQISGSSDFLSSISEGQGENSPYKNVYFNGSLGTMIGYAFTEKYHITVEPSYRFAMNSFTKEDFYLNSFPSSFMVSFGVAYNFK